MFVLLGSLLRLLVAPPNLRDIALENLALRQQLAVFKRKCPRPRLRGTDRFFWVWLSRSWKDWHRVLIIVRPETVVAWHRKGFRLFWSWISRRKSGRPEASPEVRALILKMAAANPVPSQNHIWLKMIDFPYLTFQIYLHGRTSVFAVASASFARECPGSRSGESCPASAVGGDEEPVSATSAANR